MSLARKSLLSDKELLKNILSGMTKEPITRDRWMEFAKSAFTIENTNAYLEIYKFLEVYHTTCEKIGLSSNIKDDILAYPADPSLLTIECAATNELELKEWTSDISSKLINLYIKPTGEKQLNLRSKERDTCLSDFQSGNTHPSIFLDVLYSIRKMIIENDLPKFKQAALDHNIRKEHQRIRFITAVSSSVIAIALLVLFIGLNLVQYYRFLCYPSILTAFLGYFQWKNKFCVAFSDRKQVNTGGYTGLMSVDDDYACQYQSKRSKMIKIKSFSCSIVILAVFFAVPPYSF
eukprot:NODE_554_length_6758_cov_0.359964.p2 type:complete len:291 gc:universal NODE_554_length_6758_cov_0.359964:2529-1657(-)